MTEKDLHVPEVDVSIQLNELHLVPIPDELKRAIEEALRYDARARDQITRLGVLEFVRRHGGEIRVVKASNESAET